MFHRCFVVIALGAMFWACSLSFGAAARAQFAHDHRCETADLAEESGYGRVRVRGCGQAADYLCTEQPSPVALDDRVVCVSSSERGGPWPANGPSSQPRPGTLDAE